jgi:predicted aconitase
MIRMDLHGQDVTDEELAVVVGAALAAVEENEIPVFMTDLSTLDDTSAAAVLGAMAAAGLSFQQLEPSLSPANPAWRRPLYEQSVRPRWR